MVITLDIFFFDLKLLFFFFKMEAVKNKKCKIKEDYNSNILNSQIDVFNPSKIPNPFSLDDYNDQFIQQSSSVPDKTIITTSKFNNEKEYDLEQDVVLKT